VSAALKIVSHFCPRFTSLPGLPRPGFTPFNTPVCMRFLDPWFVTIPPRVNAAVKIGHVFFFENGRGPIVLLAQMFLSHWFPFFFPVPLANPFFMSRGFDQLWSPEPQLLFNDVFNVFFPPILEKPTVFVRSRFPVGFPCRLFSALQTFLLETQGIGRAGTCSWISVFRRDRFFFGAFPVFTTHTPFNFFFYFCVFDNQHGGGRASLPHTTTLARFSP